MASPTSNLRPLHPASARNPADLRVALALSLLLAAAGQWLLQSRPAMPLPGLLCYALAAGAFAVLAPPARPAPFKAAPVAAGPPVLGLWVTSLALSLYVVANAPRHLPHAHNRLLVMAWLASLALFAWSSLRAARWRPAWPAPAAWRRAAAPGLLLAVALLIRVADLEAHPYSFINDEGEVGKAALSLLSGQRSDLFHTGWSAQPMWSFVPTAI